LLILKNLSASFSVFRNQVADFPGLIRFVFFKDIGNSQLPQLAPSRQVCTCANTADNRPT
jgi:hypothetical protein